MAEPMKAANAGKAYTAVEIVCAVAALVPSPYAFVPELIAAQLPQVIPEDDVKKLDAKAHLVDLEISGSLPKVLEGPIPHKTWIATLKHELAKATESGSVVTAVKHPTEDGLILPLWAIPVWDSIAVASQECMLWQRADVWLRPGTHRPEDQALVERVQGLMGRIPWTMMAWPLALGARGHLPRGYIVSSWWVLKQFAPTLPGESMVGTFKKYPPIRPQRTHQVKCEFFVKEPSDLLRTDLAGTFWVLFKSTHQFAPIVPSG